jgi:dethiobiotin synthetase
LPLALVEGAGGLLSPLGEDFDSCDLIVELEALPVIVALNRLGAINQVRLVLAALPSRFRRRAQVVLVAPARTEVTNAGNVTLLAEFMSRERIHRLPRLKPENAGPIPRSLARTLDALLH